MSWLKRSLSELLTAGLVAERGGLAVLPGLIKEGLYGITLLIGVVVSDEVDIILIID